MAECEAVGLTVSSSKSEAMVFCYKTVDCFLLSWEQFAAPIEETVVQEQGHDEAQDQNADWCRSNLTGLQWHQVM